MAEFPSAPVTMGLRGDYASNGRAIHHLLRQGYTLTMQADEDSGQDAVRATLTTGKGQKATSVSVTAPTMMTAWRLLIEQAMTDGHVRQEEVR